MADQSFSISSGFYNSVNGDRVYSADDMNLPYKRFVSEGVYAPPSYNERFSLHQTGEDLILTLSAGGALFAGKWIDSPAAQEITVPANNTAYNRIDTLLIQVDTRLEGRAAYLVYRTGTPSANPVHPDINHATGVYELPLYDVDIDAGATAIYMDDIHDRRVFASVTLGYEKFQQIDARLDALENTSKSSFSPHVDGTVTFDINVCRKVGKIAVFSVSGTATQSVLIHFPLGFTVKDVPSFAVGLKNGSAATFEFGYSTPQTAYQSGIAFNVPSGTFSMAGTAVIN